MNIRVHFQRLAISVAAAAFLFALTVAPAVAQVNPGISVPIAGSGPGGTLQGTLNITEFVRNSTNQLVAQGFFTGTVRDTAGNIVGTVFRTVRFVVDAQSTATCPILHLELGPIDLDLLGLVI